MFRSSNFVATSMKLTSTLLDILRTALRKGVDKMLVCP